MRQTRQDDRCTTYGAGSRLRPDIPASHHQVTRVHDTTAPLGGHRELRPAGVGSCARISRFPTPNAAAGSEWFLKGPQAERFRRQSGVRRHRSGSSRCSSAAQHAPPLPCRRGSQPHTCDSCGGAGGRSDRETIRAGGAHFHLPPCRRLIPRVPASRRSNEDWNCVTVVRYASRSRNRESFSALVPSPTL